jgi:dephospho-CoA kinase
VTGAGRKVPVIGLVGGVGSGKSCLARKLRDNHPIEIVEGDTAGHQVLKDAAVKEEIRRRFGEEVFDSVGEVDRGRLGRMVFGSGPDRRSARAALEAIVHPRITDVLIRELAEAQSRPGVEAVILDAAVLLEAGWRTMCDALIFVEAPYEERLARVQATRGWNAADLKSREESQLTLEAKRKEASDVVDNSRTTDHALRQLEEIYSRIVARQPT